MDKTLPPHTWDTPENRREILDAADHVFQCVAQRKPTKTPLERLRLLVKTAKERRHRLRELVRVQQRDAAADRLGLVLSERVERDYRQQRHLA